MKNITLEKIHHDVEQIKEQLNYLSLVLVERMTDEDVAELDQALKEYRQGNTKSIDDI